MTEIPKPRLKYLSPTSLNWFEKNKDMFVLCYVLGEKREGQTRAMAMGSGFDARIKGELEADLLGVPNRWETLFNDQVDKVLRKFVLPASAEVLEAYKRTGAYAALLRRIQGYTGTPRFEFDASGIVTVNDLDIPVFGKPDAYIELPECLYVLDWKVNGYMSQASPAAGYVTIRSENGHDQGAHKAATVMNKLGMSIALGNTMREDWQTQLLIYQLMLDANPQKPWVACIEQLAFDVNKRLRVATHQTMIGSDFTNSVLQRLYVAWKAIKDEHYYTALTKEESDAKVRALMSMDDLDKWALMGG